MGRTSGQDRPLIYQARVTATDENGDGQLDVRGVVYIGSGMYQHDLGIIGTAANLEEAVRRYGKITWTPDDLKIGGDSGVMATLSRAKLESHR